MIVFRRKFFNFVMHHVRREPIAVLLLIAAFLSALFTWQQVQVNLPKVELTRLLGFGGEVSFLGAKPETGFIAAETLHIVNSGGRAATLTVLDSTSLPSFMEVVIEGGHPKLRATNAYVVEIGVLKDDVPRTLETMLTAAKGLKYERLDFPYELGEPIESGKTKRLALVFRLRGKDGRLVINAPISFSCKAKFSDGSTFDIFANFSGGA